MALGEAQLVSSLYTPQRLGSIAQKLNDTNRLSAINTRKTREKREKHAIKISARKAPRKTRGKHAKNILSARKARGKHAKTPRKRPKIKRFLPLLQESHLNYEHHCKVLMFYNRYGSLLQRDYTH